MLIPVPEEVLDPALPIVDPHHHLWDRPGDRYLLDEFLRDISSGHAIRATVYVECGSMYREDLSKALRPVGEAEFVQRVAIEAAGNPAEVCAAMIGYADLREAEPLARLIEREQQASGGRLRAIRQSACWDADTSFGAVRTRAPPGLLSDQAFRAGFERLSSFGLGFEAWLYHPQLSDLVRLARDFPETTIVLNHLGGPLGAGAYAGRRDEIFQDWSASLRELARSPNVHVKLGGLGMPLCGFGFQDRQVPPSSAELAQAWRPYVETALDLFGVRRCMFESNFPVERVSCSYGVVWNAFKRIAADFSDDEKAQLFSRTATRVYGLAL